MSDVGRDIAAAFAQAQADDALEAASARYRVALKAVKDPSADDSAWTEYEAAIEALAELREDRA